MKRLTDFFCPVDADGVPHPRCGGFCQQGRRACDCEMSLDIGPDDKRVIQPPAPPRSTRRELAWVLIVNLIALGSLAGLIAISAR